MGVLKGEYRVDEWEEEEHPRDDDGKFSTKNGGKKPSRKLTKEEYYGEEDLSRATEGNSLGKYVKNGKLTPARERMHRKIIDSLFAGKPKANGTPVMTFMGGGPAAGKGTIKSSPEVDYPYAEDTVMIDSDWIKQMIPEYGQMLMNGDGNDAANYVHAESSAIAYRALEIAQREGYNVLLDGTGDSTVQCMIESIRQARARGMKVNAIYATCATETAVERAALRASRTGRTVPVSYIRKTHASVSRIFPEIASEFDSVSLFDTNGQKATLIAKCKRGSRTQVVNKEMYEEFLKKAKERYGE